VFNQNKLLTHWDIVFHILFPFFLGERLANAKDIDTRFYFVLSVLRFSLFILGKKLSARQVETK
jgi:hypothetical protein